MRPTWWYICICSELSGHRMYLEIEFMKDLLWYPILCSMQMFLECWCALSCNQRSPMTLRRSFSLSRCWVVFLFRVRQRQSCFRFRESCLGGIKTILRKFKALTWFQSVKLCSRGSPFTIETCAQKCVEACERLWRCLCRLSILPFRRNFILQLHFLIFSDSGVGHFGKR